MSSVYIGLGQPEPELLQRHELSDILFRRLAFYYEGLRTSDQNIMSKWTSEFTLGGTENTKNLSTLTSNDILFPLWAERKVTTGTNVIWEFVPTVNLDTLTDRRINGDAAVAFYGESPSSITAAFSYYGNEVQTPATTFRIRYQPVSTFSQSESATVAVPDNLTPLIVADVTLHAVPLMTVNASKWLKDRPELAQRMDAWNAVAQQALIDKEEWMPLFEQFTRRSRGAGRARNRNDILSGRNSLRARRYYNS